MLIPMVTAAALVGTTAAASAQTAPATAGAIGSAPRAKATLDQVAWIAGPWEGMLGDRKIEQHWMAPAAELDGGDVSQHPEGSRDALELLAIEQDGEALILRIKHFVPGPGLAGREAKDESIDHALVRVDGRTAVFEGPARRTRRASRLRVPIRTR